MHVFLLALCMTMLHYNMLAALTALLFNAYA